MSRASIERLSRQLTKDLHAFVDDGTGVCVVKAPPGSGKTHTLVEVVAHALSRRRRVAVATQTNAQADDVVQRLLSRLGGPVFRFAPARSAKPEGADSRLQWVTNAADLPDGTAVVVGTTAKWAMTKSLEPFDLLIADEAWQMSWADFMLLGRVAGQFLLIGDPGQIPPVVAIPVHRWETSPRAPHYAAPDVILGDPTIGALSLCLPACRRLPDDTVDLVRPFYDFDFDAWALPGERWVRAKRGHVGDPIDDAIDRLADRSVAIVTMGTPAEGPPLEHDPDIAELVAALADRLLGRRATAAANDDGTAERLKPADIGIAATHRVMNAAIQQRVSPTYLHQGLRVDTPERWQGLERKVMIVVHPLSGVARPSAFDFDTGRLCVMASRHRSGLVVVSRDHVIDTLDQHIPSAEQPPGRPDVVGRGHAQHLQFWLTVESAGGLVAA